jgi:PAS domain-containing protein
LDSPYFILLCSAVAAWYAFRYFRLKRGISDLTQALRATPPDGPIELPRFTDIPTLYEFRRVLADTLSEANLLRDSERKQREFQDALLNEIKDAIFILDRNREIRFVNEARFSRSVS